MAKLYSGCVTKKGHTEIRNMEDIYEKYGEIYIKNEYEKMKRDNYIYLSLRESYIYLSTTAAKYCKTKLFLYEK